MGLQVWLPLNGNLENKGLTNVSVTNDGASIEDDGKIGKCYSFRTTKSYLLIPKESMTSVTEASVCFWLKILDWNASYATFFQAGKDGNAWNNYIFGFLRNSTQSTCCFTISNGSSASNASYLTPSLELNTWYHIGLVYKSGHCLIYINGDLYHDYSTSIVPNFEAITTISVGKANSSYQSHCSMNDLRIYNEALSPMQIKLISQGLVAHYLLNNNGSGLPNYFKNSNFSTGTTTGWTGVNSSVISIEEIDNKKTITATKGTTNYLIRQLISNYEYVASTDVSFVISADVYVTEIGTINIGQWISSSEVSGWQAMTGNTTWLTSNNLSIGWNHIIYKATKRNSYNGSIVIAFNYTGTTAYFTNLKFEFSDKPTSWCPNSTDSIYTLLGYDNNIEYDVSGYCNNGIKYNIIDYITDSPRYSVATKFNGTNSYINVGRGGMVRDEITVNIWGYMDDWTKFNSRLVSCTENGGWNFETSSGKIHFSIGTGTTSNAYKTTSGYSLSELSSGWHMFTGTYDGLVVKQYVDGVFINSSNNAYTTKTPIHYHSNNSILIGAEATGSATSAASPYFNGYLSDVRIYATALSESDIQSLYNNSAFIDSSGNVYSTEYTEL